MLLDMAHVIHVVFDIVGELLDIGLCGHKAWLTQDSRIEKMIVGCRGALFLADRLYLTKATQPLDDLCLQIILRSHQEVAMIYIAYGFRIYASKSCFGFEGHVRCHTIHYSTFLSCLKHSPAFCSMTSPTMIETDRLGGGIR